MDKYKNLSCSFCGRNEAEVKTLIRGIAGNICDECIAMCHNIIESNTEIPEEEQIDLAHVLRTILRTVEAIDL